MVLLYLKDAGSCRSTISGMPDAATADLRAFPSSFPVECHAYRIYSMALYFPGRVKSLIWTDVLKTFCLVVSVVLCIYYIASNLHLNFSGLATTISDSDFSKTFFFDDVNDKRYFFKQFLAGVFTVIAMNGSTRI